MRLVSQHNDYLTSFSSIKQESLFSSPNLHGLSSPEHWQDLGRAKPHLHSSCGDSEFQSNRSSRQLLLNNVDSYVKDHERSRPLSLAGLGIRVDNSSQSRTDGRTIYSQSDRSSLSESFRLLTQRLPIDISPPLEIESDFLPEFAVDADDLRDSLLGLHGHFDVSSVLQSGFCSSNRSRQNSAKNSRPGSFIDSPQMHESSSSDALGDRYDLLEFSMPSLIADINMFTGKIYQKTGKTIAPSEVTLVPSMATDDGGCHKIKLFNEKDDGLCRYDGSEKFLPILDRRNNEVSFFCCDSPPSFEPSEFEAFPGEKRKRKEFSPPEIAFKSPLNPHSDLTVILESLLEAPSEHRVDQTAGSERCRGNITRSKMYVERSSKKQPDKAVHRSSLASQIRTLLQSNISTTFCDLPITDSHLGITEETVAHKVASYKLAHPGERLPDSLLFCFAGKQTHSLPKPITSGYICYILNCGKTTKRKDHMADHIRTHLGEKPFQCRICGLGFIRSNDCLRHENNHSSDKKFVCVCKAAFSRRDLFVRHRRMSCPRQYTTKTILGDINVNSEMVQTCRLGDTQQRQPPSKRSRT